MQYFFLAEDSLEQLLGSSVCLSNSVKNLWVFFALAIGGAQTVVADNLFQFRAVAYNVENAHLLICSFCLTTFITMLLAEFTVILFSFLGFPSTLLIWLWYLLLGPCHQSKSVLDNVLAANSNVLLSYFSSIGSSFADLIDLIHKC